MSTSEASAAPIAPAHRATVAANKPLSLRDICRINHLARAHLEFCAERAGFDVRSMEILHSVAIFYETFARCFHVVPLAVATQTSHVHTDTVREAVLARASYISARCGRTTRVERDRAMRAVTEWLDTGGDVARACFDAPTADPVDLDVRVRDRGGGMGRVRLSVRLDQQPVEADISTDRLDELRARYLGTTDASTAREQEFLLCTMKLLVRYQLIMGDKNQCDRLPAAVFDLLKRWGCQGELFAHPAHTSLPQHWSLFASPRDPDVMFGSRGTFWDAAPTSGCFEVNPPFGLLGSDASVFGRLADLLARAEKDDEPLSFVVVAPFTAFERSTRVRAFIARELTLARGKHVFHTDAPNAERASPVDSKFVVYQSKAARAKWPVKGAWLRDIERAFAPSAADNSEEPTPEREAGELSRGEARGTKRSRFDEPPARASDRVEALRGAGRATLAP